MWVCLFFPQTSDLRVGFSEHPPRGVEIAVDLDNPISSCTGRIGGLPGSYSLDGRV